MEESKPSSSKIEIVKGIMHAIQAVQQTLGTIKKTSTGQVGSRNYKYADINDIWLALLPVLKQNDLVLTQSPVFAASAGGDLFETTIYHLPTAESITKQMRMIVTKEDPQGVGSAITYYRRYMVISMLGLITDDDTDAAEHRLATAQQKMQIVGAVKQLFDTDPTPDQIKTTITDIVGKHPSLIREDEAQSCVDLIKAFGASKK